MNQGQNEVPPLVISITQILKESSHKNTRVLWILVQLTYTSPHQHRMILPTQVLHKLV